MRSVILAAPRMCPIRMNSGAATIGNEFIDPAIFCGRMVTGMPAIQMNSQRREAIDTYSGMPSAMVTSQPPKILPIRPIMVAHLGVRRVGASVHRSCRACTRVNAPAGSSGAYIQAVEIGSDTASMSALTWTRWMLLVATTAPMVATANWISTSVPRQAPAGSRSCNRRMRIWLP